MQASSFPFCGASNWFNSLTNDDKSKSVPLTRSLTQVLTHHSLILFWMVSWGVPQWDIADAEIKVPLARGDILGDLIPCSDLKPGTLATWVGCMPWKRIT